MIGRIVGTYKIQSKLGEGGMGAVYKGVDTMLDREVAIKALRPELASQTSIVERFRTEAVTLAKLQHPNIATLYSLFRQGEELFMVLEYVRGETLDEVMRRKGALSPESILPAFCQVLDGIDHAHALGIIHRDLKPANIVLNEDGIPKVLDFGIARLLGSSRMTRAGSIIGTLEYMAPEQVKGLETDARTDTYALGMLLYEALAGRAPFTSENEFELMKLQTECMPVNPRSIRSSIPVELDAAIMRAISKDPDARFQTAGEFRDRLVSSGLVSAGTGRRITGSDRVVYTAEKPTELASPPPSGVGAQVLKETRLGTAPVSALGSAVTDSETEMATTAAVGNPTVATAGLFDRLTAVHYAGAGVAVVIVLAVLIVIPVVFFGGTSKETRVEQPRQGNSNTADRVRSAETPAPESPGVSSRPVATPAPQEKPIAPIVLTPVEPRQDPPTGSAPSKPDQPAKRPPTATKKPAKSRDSELRNARCALTGDC
ncbi:MAG TPA: protein kinase [Pyrinomonadaceae bacterium]|nr:protein kinase [Pyrinomonadaceae bacterium]